ncbi:MULTISPECIES: helix-turn-helix domain-containing protein [Staphylococcus]|uniref:helix-turn-helix domain-containing protein n=1 Tax=Staphylococcus TaxID=1279 RepID=UPI0005E1FE72|nr:MULTISPECIES: helix-turn-helix transcriptional regulator [Staphylococcus]PTI86187.1 XRE family transcriptional regulator [Staphylococcus warneri]QNQ44289.1 helix-turn-helix transcriptional regulator [Staphylococcus warneri]UGB05442.1 helix-turn-helix domain-containing protein [Staphylococcus sp. HL28]COD84264.1 XRE family transcriptional regulator [Staphylococcus warneri]
MTLGQKIKEHRINLGETMAEFGQRFNAKSGVVSNWENNKQKPNNKRLKILADNMGITVTELLGSVNNDGKNNY